MNQDQFESEVVFERVLDKQLVEEFGDEHGFMATEKLLAILEEIGGSGIFVVESAKLEDQFVLLSILKKYDWSAAKEYALLSSGSLLE